MKMLDLLRSSTIILKDEMKTMKELIAGDTFKLMSQFIGANIQQWKEQIKKNKHLKPQMKYILKDTTSSSTQIVMFDLTFIDCRLL